jgi:hypothetical protein
VPYLVSFLVGAAIVSIVNFRVIHANEGTSSILTGLYFARAGRASRAEAPRVYAADSIDGS